MKHMKAQDTITKVAPFMIQNLIKIMTWRVSLAQVISVERFVVNTRDIF